MACGNIGFSAPQLLVLAVTGLLIGGLAGPAAAQAPPTRQGTTITFDDLVPPARTAAIPIADHYGAQGIRFAGACLPNSLAWTAVGFRARSGKNMAVPCAILNRNTANSRRGQIVLQFDLPVDRVSVATMLLSSYPKLGAMRLTAYDAAGKTLAQAQLPFAKQRAARRGWTVLAVSDPDARIAKAAITTPRGQTVFAIDDVTFAQPEAAFLRSTRTERPWTGQLRRTSLVGAVAPISPATAMAALLPMPLPQAVPVPRLPKQRPWPWIAGGLGLALAGLGAMQRYRNHRDARLRARVTSRVVSRSDPLPAASDCGATPAISIGVALVAPAGLGAPGTEIAIAQDGDDDGRA